MSLGRQIAVLVVLMGVGTLVGSVLLSIALQLYFSASDHAARIVLFDIVRFAAFTSVISVPAGVLFGVPAFFALRRVGVLRWWSVGAFGALLGAAIGATSIAAGVPWPGSVAIGLVSALIAWRLIVHSGIPLGSEAPKSAAPTS
jgi:hypothetical protein